LDSRYSLPIGTVLDGGYRISRVVGSGGFGITYAAADMTLGTTVALKEYYPFDFGDRDTTLSVRPKSERHRATFDWGRSNFLQEARTLARFEHPSIVRVTRAFEANATAYMVMRFEQGPSLEAWLRNLGRPPTQEELDRVVAPLLDALEIMHAADFLHRDIAPDNIIVRADGTPVLLDFGAARRAVAEMSRALTGVVKAGFSPHEQYSSDSRQQGPWSDIYALGATLYRAVCGRPPEEAALRVDKDPMLPATEAALGDYRKRFLGAIDACLKVRYSERPQSVAELRPMLLAPSRRNEPRLPLTSKLPVSRHIGDAIRPTAGRWFAVAAAVVALAGGVYGGLEYSRWQPPAQGPAVAEAYRPSSEADARPTAQEAARRQAELDLDRRRTEVEAARRRAEAEAERRRSEDAARQRAAEAERQRAEEQRRREEEAQRIAAEDEAARKAEIAAADKRKEQEHARAAAAAAAAALSADERAAFVKRVQTLLTQTRCYDGAIDGRGGGTQESLDRFIQSVGQKGKAKPARIELAKATASDFETWLQGAGELKGDICAPKAKPAKPEAAKTPRKRNEESDAQARQQANSKPQGQTQRSGGDDRPGRGGSCGGWMYYNTSCTDSAGRRCTQTPGGCKCD
jgi:serine/threonine protein kinase